MKFILLFCLMKFLCLIPVIAMIYGAWSDCQGKKSLEEEKKEEEDAKLEFEKFFLEQNKK